jgi:biotin carboxyl carrier protein
MKYRYQAGDTVYEVLLERRGELYRATVNGEAYDVEVVDAQPGALTLRFAGSSVTPVEGTAVPLRSQTVYWGAEGQRQTKWLSAQGCTYRLERPKERRPRHAAGAAPEDSLRAPMPARVRAVQVVEGEAVEAGQTVLLLEAMKMEIRLPAPRAARVARVLAQTGEQVERDQVLVELEAQS